MSTWSEKASEAFSLVPKKYNCAQSVAIGCGAEDLVPELASCGGGRAPGGLCGALHAALLFVPEDKKEQLKKEFASSAGSLFCREIRKANIFSCAQCVAKACELSSEIRNDGPAKSHESSFCVSQKSEN